MVMFKGTMHEETNKHPYTKEFLHLDHAQQECRSGTQAAHV